MQYSFRTLLLKSTRIFTEKMNTRLQAHALNYSLWQVLFVIEQKQQCSFVEIAMALNISQPAISKRMFELEKMDLVTLVFSQNRREKNVKLNAHGQQLFQTCKAEIDAIERHYLTQIDEQSLQSTKMVLQIFLANLQQEG